MLCASNSMTVVYSCSPAFEHWASGGNCASAPAFIAPMLVPTIMDQFLQHQDAETRNDPKFKEFCLTIQVTNFHFIKAVKGKQHWNNSHPYCLIARVEATLSQLSESLPDHRNSFLIIIPGVQRPCSSGYIMLYIIWLVSRLIINSNLIPLAWRTSNGLTNCFCKFLPALPARKRPGEEIRSTYSGFRCLSARIPGTDTRFRLRRDIRCKVCRELLKIAVYKHVQTIYGLVFRVPKGGWNAGPYIFYMQRFVLPTTWAKNHEPMGTLQVVNDGGHVIKVYWGRVLWAQWIMVMMMFCPSLRNRWYVWRAFAPPPESTKAVKFPLPFTGWSLPKPAHSNRQQMWLYRFPLRSSFLIFFCETGICMIQPWMRINTAIALLRSCKWTRNRSKHWKCSTPFLCHVHLTLCCGLFGLLGPFMWKTLPIYRTPGISPRRWSSH